MWWSRGWVACHPFCVSLFVCYGGRSRCGGRVIVLGFGLGLGRFFVIVLILGRVVGVWVGVGIGCMARGCMGLGFRSFSTMCEMQGSSFPVRVHRKCIRDKFSAYCWVWRRVRGSP